MWRKNNQATSNAVGKKQFIIKSLMKKKATIKPGYVIAL